MSANIRRFLATCLGPPATTIKDSIAASSTEAMAMIKDVAPGQLVRLIVQAVNGTRQGVASEPIEFTMPLAAAPEASKTQAQVLELPLVENTNGNDHGHANGTDYS